MIKYVLSLMFLNILFSCNQTKAIKEENITETKKQIAPVLTDYTQLFSKFSSESEKIYVVNYWATWCKPCIEELPHFMEVNKAFSKNVNFEMILVSLDKADARETDVLPFIEKNNITTDVFILSDNKRMTQWIPLVNERWSGAIPATAIYKNGKQVAFKEGQLSKNELTELINQHL